MAHVGAATALACTGERVAESISETSCDYRSSVSAADESDDKQEVDSSSSTSTRIAIGLIGLLIAVGLGVQQARSRLQTKDPDTL